MFDIRICAQTFLKASSYYNCMDVAGISFRFKLARQRCRQAALQASGIFLFSYSTGQCFDAKVTHLGKADST